LVKTALRNFSKNVQSEDFLVRLSAFFAVRHLLLARNGGSLLKSHAPPLRVYTFNNFITSENLVVEGLDKSDRHVFGKVHLCASFSEVVQFSVFSIDQVLYISHIFLRAKLSH